MQQKISKKYFINCYLLFMLFVCSCLIGGPSAIAAVKGKGPVKNSLVNIKERKGDIVISSSQTFLITDKTEVFDRDDRQIESGDLPVPCRAYIDYQLTAEGKAVALTIKVKQLLNVRRGIPE